MVEILKSDFYAFSVNGIEIGRRPIGTLFLQLLNKVPQKLIIQPLGRCAGLAYCGAQGGLVLRLAQGSIVFETMNKVDKGRSNIKLTA